MNDTLEGLIEKLAPVRNGVNGIERYNAAGLLRRIGVDEEDLQELLESGTLCPCGKGQTDVTGKDEVYPFKSDDLNALRRALVLEGLKAIAAENETEDFSEGEKAFCRSAEFIFAMERKNEPKSRNPVAMHFAQGALSRAAGRVIELEAPLTGKVARDRYVKKLKDDDQSRRDANILRAGTTGALAGALLPFRKLKRAHRALVGAGAGAAGVLAVRKATEATQDAYGERSLAGKRGEALPAVAGLGLAGYAVARKVRRIPGARFIFESSSPRSEFAIADSAIGLLQRIGTKLACESRRRLIGGAGLLGGTSAGLKAATDDDPETSVRGQTLAGGLKGAAVGAAGVIGAPLAYGAAKGIAARMRGLRPGMLRGLF